MGRIVKQISQNTTRHYWYPGDKKEWIRAGVAIGLGGVVLGALFALTRDILVAVVVGASVTLALAGFNIGRRDARALTRVPDRSGRAARMAAVGHGGRAAWRGLVQGFAGAAAAVGIVNLPHRGAVADWLLPVVPAISGALAHQAGMLYEQLGQSSSSMGVAAPAEVEGSVLDDAAAN